MTVRPLLPGDGAALRGLCLETTPLRTRREVERFVVLQVYCTYYLERELGHCFVAEKDGELCAALLCAPDFTAYERRFMQSAQKKCEAYGITAAANARQVALVHRGVAGQYPAHCIPMLRSGQADAAAPLLAALREHLEAMDVRGVCTFTGRKQGELRGVLESLGFEPVSRKSGIDTLGLIFE